MKNMIIILITLVFNFTFANTNDQNTENLNTPIKAYIDYLEQCSNLNYMNSKMVLGIEVIAEIIITPNKTKENIVKSTIKRKTALKTTTARATVKFRQIITPVELNPATQELDISEYLPEENDDYLLAVDEFENNNIEQEFEKEITQEVIVLDSKGTSYFN